MGFPIFSLIVTRIIGIPQSLLLRVVGIPQFSPWVYGIPHALFCLSPKVFFSGFGIPQFSPGVYGIPHALFRLSPKVFLFLELSCPLQLCTDFPWSSSTATRPRSLERHGLYLELEHGLTSCDPFLKTTQRSFNAQELQNFPKFLEEFPLGPPRTWINVL